MVDADRSIGPESAVRLICRADDNGVRVISSRPLAKIVPPSEPIGDDDLHGQPRSGFWIEVRDEQERPRYRRVICRSARQRGGGSRRRRLLHAPPGDLRSAARWWV